MKIVKYVGHGKVEIAATSAPEPDEKSVILKVMASALCGSELGSLRDGMSGEESFNAGHEVVGIVEDAPNDSEFKPGMRVGACVVQGCGQCAYCAMGRETACTDKSFYAGNGHAEYFKLGLNGVLPLPDDVDWPEAVLLAGDALGVPARAAARLGDTRGKKVFIAGLGPVGLSNLLVQSFNGAEIMGSDPSEYRRKLAEKLGTARTIDPLNDDVEERVLDWTDGVGADIAILAVGREEALTTCAAVLKHQGTLFQVAEFAAASINPSAMFVQKELTMTGSWYFTSEDWPNMVEYWRSGLELKKMCTHIFPFNQAQEAVDTFVSGNSGKVVLTYE